MTYLMVIILTGQMMVVGHYTDLNQCRQEARYKSLQTQQNHGCMPIYLEGPRAPLR